VSVTQTDNITLSGWQSIVLTILQSVNLLFDIFVNSSLISQSVFLPLLVLYLSIWQSFAHTIFQPMTSVLPTCNHYPSILPTKILEHVKLHTCDPCQSTAFFLFILSTQPVHLFCLLALSFNCLHVLNFLFFTFQFFSSSILQFFIYFVFPSLSPSVLSPSSLSASSL
jgi:hypothetical protein